MSVADEIKKLQELHESGALSREEFAQAKAALLDDAPDRDASRTETLVGSLFPEQQETLGQAANRYVSLKIADSALGWIAIPIVLTMGAIVFLLFFLFIILPSWNEQAANRDKAEKQREKFDADFEQARQESHEMRQAVKEAFSRQGFPTMDPSWTIKSGESQELLSPDDSRFKEIQERLKPRESPNFP